VEAVSIDKRYGGVQALRGVSFELRQGEILGLIGPNGSGKSTCVNVLSGTVRPTAGQVLLEGVDVSRAPIDAIVSHGMIRTYQATQTFPEYTALENVLLGCHSRRKVSPIASVLRSRPAREEEAKMEAAARDALETVGLGHRASALASTLSAADQRLLMIAVMIAAAPKVILLDEPAAGMVSSERKALAEVIRGLPAIGNTRTHAVRSRAALRSSPPKHGRPRNASTSTAPLHASHSAFAMNRTCAATRWLRILLRKSCIFDGMRSACAACRATSSSDRKSPSAGLAFNHVSRLMGSSV